MSNNTIGILCFLFVVLFAGIPGTLAAVPDKDIDILIARMKAEYISKDFSQAHEYLAGQAG